MPSNTMPHFFNTAEEASFPSQFYKTAIGHTVGEQVCQMLADISLIVMLETPEAA